MQGTKGSKKDTELKIELATPDARCAGRCWCTVVRAQMGCPTDSLRILQAGGMVLESHSISPSTRMYVTDI